MTRSLAGTRTVAGSRTSVTRGVNNSLSFNGSSAYVSLQNFAFYRSLNQVYSVEFWIKGSAQTGKPLVLNRSTGNALWQLIGGGTGNKKLQVFIRNDGGTLLSSSITSTTDVLDNTWHHIVYTDNAGTATLYIDKVADATNFNYTISGNFSTLDRFAVGAQYNNLGSASGFFSGNIDQVRIYNIALNQSQVNAAYANSGYAASNLIFEWRFDEGSGSIAGNTGLLPLNGNIVNATYSATVPAIPNPVFSRTSS